MHRNLLTLSKIAAATTLTLTVLAIPYRWQKFQTRLTPVPEAQHTEFLILNAPSAEDLNTLATAISNRGDVVGVAFDATGKTVQAFHAKDRAFHLLPSPKGVDQAVAQGVNDRGDVVGAAITGERVQAVHWRGGKPSILDAGKADAAAAGVNDRGQIVGVGQKLKDGKILGLLWDRGGKAKNLGEFGANAIADNGLIVGARLKKDTIEAIAFQDGKLMGLPMPSGGTAAAARATNGKNAIVGAALVNDRVRAVIWDRKKAMLLKGLIEAGQSIAMGVNHAGFVVGACDAGDGQMSATVWRKGQPMEIKAPEGSGWRPVMASGINSNGFVVGWAVKGDRISGFMLGPIR